MNDPSNEFFITVGKMNDPFNEFLITIGYIATIVAIFLIGVFIGYEGSSTAEHHHGNSYNEHGELTCEMCKELLEKGRK